MVEGQLYKRGSLQPLLKCLDGVETRYVLKEIHEGCYRHHMGAKLLALKVLTVGYYCPSMVRVSREFVKHYPPCQRHAHFQKAPCNV